MDSLSRMKAIPVKIGNKIIIRNESKEYIPC